MYQVREPGGHRAERQEGEDGAAGEGQEGEAQGREAQEDAGFSGPIILLVEDQKIFCFMSGEKCRNLCGEVFPEIVGPSTTSRIRIRVRRWNSWTVFLVEVSGHNLSTLRLKFLSSFLPHFYFQLNAIFLRLSCIVDFLYVFYIRVDYDFL